MSLPPLKCNSGVVVIAIGVASALCALTVGAVGWLWLGVVIAVLLVGFVYPFITLASLHLEMMPPPDPVVAGTEDSWRLRTGRRFPWPLLGVRLCIGERGSKTTAYPVDRRDQEIRLCIPRRGHFTDSCFRAECHFPFGLWTARSRVRLARSLLVRVPTMVPKSSAACGTFGRDHRSGTRASPDGESIGVRDYVRGDSPRQISWQATARIGRLIARQRATSNQQAVIIDLDESAFAGGSDDPTSGYEYAIRTAANLVKTFAQNDFVTSLRLNDRLRLVSKTSGVADVLDELALLPHLPRQARLASTRPPYGAMAVLLTADRHRNEIDGYTAVLRFTRESVTRATAQSVKDPLVISTHEQWLTHLSALTGTRGFASAN